MKMSEIKDLSSAEIEKKLRELVMNFYNCSFANKPGKSKNPT